MVSYVLGFLFDDINYKGPKGPNVVLIEKARPAWQAGKFNGVGGKIELDELPWEAMVREFREETGVSTQASDWRYFTVLNFADLDAKLHVFVASDREAFNNVKTMTDEKVVTWQVDLIPNTQLVVPNLKWLIPMAMSEPNKSFVVIEHGIS